MKTIGTKEVNYSLHNNENYKKELDTEINDVVNKLSELFVDYFKFITENMKLKKSRFSKFIIIRGLDTIIHVFNHILLYTKNVDVTYFHCQKAFYFYVEFVGQISEDEKIFLQLSSRDASRYVYNKTIFEINNEFKKNNEYISDYTRLKLDIINVYVDLYRTIMLKLINNDFLNNEKLSIVKNIYNKFNNVANKSKIHLLNDIIDKLYYDIEDETYFLNCCDLLAKKNKNIDSNKNCLHKFLSEEFRDKLNETHDKFITWLLN